MTRAQHVAELTRVTIGANPAGTVFNIIGGGFAKVIQENMGVPSIVRPYSGSSVYLPFLHQGAITLGINSSIDSVLSYTGQEPFRAAMTNIRALISAYPVGYMYWVRASSDLYRIEDLEGSRVVINYRGLVGLDRLNRAILATGGLSEDDVRSLTAAGLPEGMRLVLEGRADAVPMSYQIPLVQQAHASLPGGLRFLLMGQNEARLVELMPGTRVATAQPSVNTVGIYEPIRTASYDAYLNAGTHISEEDAYRLVKTLHEHWGCKTITLYLGQRWLTKSHRRTIPTPIIRAQLYISKRLVFGPKHTRRITDDLGYSPML